MSRKGKGSAFLDRSIQQWYVSDLAKKSLALVTEPEAKKSLTDHMPPSNAPRRRWIEYRDFLVGDISDNFQISVAKGTDQISIAEGNHRIDILYNDLILKGRIPDFKLKVYAEIVSPEDLGTLTMERAAGKQQALHFRFLLNLNYQLGHVLGNLGFDTSKYGADSFDLLESLLNRIRYEHNLEQQVDQTKTKIHGLFNELVWLPGKDLFSENGFSDSIDAKVQALILSNDADISRLASVADKVGQLPKEIFKEAVTKYLNAEAYQTKMNDPESAPSQKKTYISGLVKSAVRRVLLERITANITEKIEPWEQKGAITYTSVHGYSLILQKMSEGSKRAGIPLRQLVEILGGRRFGSDTRSYNPIEECYDRLSRDIEEPYRTRLVAHILNLTGSLHESRTHRRDMTSAINQAIRSISEDGTFDKSVRLFIEGLLSRDLSGVYIYAALNSAGYSPASLERVSSHLESIIPASAKRADSIAAQTIVSQIVNAERAVRGSRANSFSRVFDSENVDDLMHRYKVVRSVTNQKSRPNGRAGATFAELEELYPNEPLPAGFPIPTYADFERYMNQTGRHNLFSSHRLQKSETLYFQGDLGQKVYFVKSGEVFSLHYLDNDQSFLIGRHSSEKGYILGLDSLAGLRFTTQIEVRSDQCEYMELDAKEFDKFLVNDPKLNIAMHQYQSLALAQAHKRMAQLVSMEGNQRLADYLLRSAYEQNSTKICRAADGDVAMEIGLSRPRTNRALFELHNQGYIIASKSHITLVDVSGLVDVIQRSRDL